MSDLPMKKRCLRCREWKTLDNFYNNRSMADGKAYYCKICHKETMPPLDEEMKARKRKMNNAKRKAMQRLANLYPEMFVRLYKEECAKVGLEPQWIKQQFEMVE